MEGPAKPKQEESNDSHSLERKPESDSLEALDSADLNTLQEMVQQPQSLEMAADLLSDINASQLVDRIAVAAQHSESASPQSFDQMMDVSIGTSWQRLQKWYFRVGDPERNKKLLETIGVDKYRNIARYVVLELLRGQKEAEHARKEGKNTNYTLAKPDFNSLLDFATNQSTLNEKIHLIGAAVCIVVGGGEAVVGDAPVTMGLLFMLNLYCILAQRYTRSRLSAAIDHKLKSHPTFDAEKYENALGIRLPVSNVSTARVESVDSED